MIILWRFHGSFTLDSHIWFAQGSEQKVWNGIDSLCCSRRRRRYSHSIIRFNHLQYHSVEIAKIYSSCFRKIFVKSAHLLEQNYTVSGLTKFFQVKSKFFDFAHCEHVNDKNWKKIEWTLIKCISWLVIFKTLFILLFIKRLKEGVDWSFKNQHSSVEN